MFSDASFKKLISSSNHWVESEDDAVSSSSSSTSKRAKPKVKARVSVPAPTRTPVQCVCDGQVETDLVYVVALDDSVQPDPLWSTLHVGIDAIVKKLQPSPVKVHCELWIPPTTKTDCCHYSTYLGSSGANYTNTWRDDENYAYYIDGPQCGHWHAIPVYGGRGFSKTVRAMADTAVHTPYSLARYACSGPPLRALSFVLPNRVSSPAHCATLCARLVDRSLPQHLGLNHWPAYYGPSTLYSELADQSRARRTISAWPKDRGRLRPAHANTLAVLLRGRVADVVGLTDAQCSAATAALAERVTRGRAVGNDTLDMERELAVALFRWSQVARESKGESKGGS